MPATALSEFHVDQEGIDEIQAWDTVDGRMLNRWRLGAKVASMKLDFSQDGRYAIGISPHAVDLFRGFREDDQYAYKHYSGVWDLSLNLRYLAMVAGDNPQEVEVVDLARDRNVVIDQHAADVQRVKLSSDGTRLASATDESQVFIWDTVTKKLLSILDIDQETLEVLAGLQFTPDHRKLLAITPEVVKAYDLESGRSLFSLLMAAPPLAQEDQRESGIRGGPGKSGGPLSAQQATVLAGRPRVICSPNGRWLATASRDETQIWDQNSGALISRWPSSNRRPRDLAFIGDSSALLRHR